MAVVRVEDLPGGGQNRERESSRALEEGHVLLFGDTPFELSEEDRAFLLERRQAEAGYHKNIAYRPQSDRVTGVARGRGEDEMKLRRVLRAYSERVVRFAAGIFPRYAARWRVDYASFRPQEEAGRKLSAHARNDLLHVDSFPTRPTGGDRIFRVFTNVNPAQPRVWRTGEDFEALAERFAVSSGLLARVSRPSFGRRVLRAARSAGLPVRVRPAYDEFMHRFHNFLKENSQYQETARAEQVSFPPGSTWMVFTDMVTHSVLSGQFALEQTFLISRDSLALPAKAPISILERISGRAMA
ncbi:MAG TPA: Kdo hydroxylase family protein [Thermoanaerobaculia bacterium]|nr:Kdo hydroxylase family protein [Thermoanaerobaculia bacterium]